MGEILKVLSKGVISEDRIVIELNSPASERDRHTIHIQTNRGRVELTIKDFRVLATANITAAMKLKAYKD